MARLMKFTDQRKTNEILSMIFWSQTLQQLHSERHEAILLAIDIPGVYCTFKAIKMYMLPNLSYLGHV